MKSYDPPGTIWRKIGVFLAGAIAKGTETTRLETLNMLAVLVAFILAYAYLDEIQALLERLLLLLPS